MVLAVLCMALAVTLRWALGLIWPDIIEIITFYPAVLVIGLARGLEADRDSLGTLYLATD